MHCRRERAHCEPLEREIVEACRAGAFAASHGFDQPSHLVLAAQLEIFLGCRQVGQQLGTYAQQPQCRLVGRKVASDRAAVCTLQLLGEEVACDAAIFALGLFPQGPLAKTELAARDYQQRVLSSRLPEAAP